MKFSTAILLAVFLGGCGEIHFIPPPAPPAPFGTLPRNSTDSGFQSYESLHFSLRGANAQALPHLSSTCEEIYRRIMFDTNLLSFKPKENYRIEIYRDRADYEQKTGLPSWSGGGTVTQIAGRLLPSERNAAALTHIQTFEDALSVPLLAHEICHLVFNEYMQFENVEQSERCLWLNEGLATYEEMGVQSEDSKGAFKNSIQPLLKTASMPLGDMVRFRPMRETSSLRGRVFVNGVWHDYTNIELWYWQVRSVTGFLIERHGQYSFFNLLAALKKGKELPGALLEAYPGKWETVQELETEWKQTL